MVEIQRLEELARLRAEVESLRFANAALERQMVSDAEQTDAMLRAMESQSQALREAGLRRLNQSNFIQRVMDTSGALIVVLGPDGRVREVNRRCEQELLDAEGSLEGRVLDEWLPADER